MRASVGPWWALRGVIVGGVVSTASGGCAEEAAKPPYLPPEEAAELAARDCAAMSCEPHQAPIAQVLIEVKALREGDDALLAELAGACTGLAGLLGAELEPPSGSSPSELVAHACVAAAGALDVATAGVGVREADVTRGCGPTLADVVSCEAACACGGCPPRADDATCAGTLVGRCDGVCTGACWPAGDEVGVACAGRCFGRCEGTCGGGLDTEGRCFGGCDGVCVGGPCEQLPVGGAPCDGRCDVCDGALENAACITSDLEGGWSPSDDASCAACSVRCAAVTATEAPCLPLGLTDDDLSPEVVGAVERSVIACMRLQGRSELRDVLADEAAALVRSPAPGSLCAHQQRLDLLEMEPLPLEACYELERAAF